MSRVNHFTRDEIALTGFTDSQLERLSGNNRRKGIRVPWVSWEAERGGQGKLFRRLAFFPKFLPLPIVCDHYVDVMSSIRQDELGQSFCHYFSWNPSKVKRINDLTDKKAHHIRHPYADYRMKEFHQSSRSAGTLFFWPHSHDKLMPIIDIDTVRHMLTALPKEMQPVTICLSAHDIAKGLHKQIRRCGFPLVTAGTLMSGNFVNRFYKLLESYKFTAGLTVGSHTWYCLDAGRSYLLLGEWPEYRWINPDGSLGETFTPNPDDYPNEVEHEEFLDFIQSLRQPMESPSKFQEEFVSKYMGHGSNFERWRFAAIVWSEFFHHIWEMTAGSLFRRRSAATLTRR